MAVARYRMICLVLQNCKPKTQKSVTHVKLRHTQHKSKLICITSRQILIPHFETIYQKRHINLYNNSFIPKTSNDWNSLPESARTVQSLEGEFRRFVDKDKITVPNYYYFWQRKFQVILTRLRLNCSSLGSDLLNNDISEKSIANDCLYNCSLM